MKAVEGGIPRELPRPREEEVDGQPVTPTRAGLQDDLPAAASRPTRMSRTTLFLWRVAFLLALLAAWEAVVRFGLVREFVAGRPLSVGKWYVENLGTRRLWHHFFITLRETAWGLGLGIAVGVVGAIILARFRGLYLVMRPFITAAFAVPRISLAPLLILWFGVGEASKVALAFLIVVFIIFFNAFAGITSVDERIVAAMRTMGASSRFIYRHAILPHSLQHIYTGIRISTGLALVVVIAGEFIAGSGGLGYLIVRSANLFFINEVMALILMLGVLGLLVELLLAASEKRLFKWKPQVDSTVWRL